MKESVSGQTIRFDTRQLEAILFDLDGVITRTAWVHAAAWKKLFDAYLHKRTKQTGEDFQPFDIETDYRRYLDGKPRDDGIKSFLASRHIALPDGQPDDPPNRDTICGLGNAKQAYFLEQLAEKGVAVYDATVSFIRQAKARGLKIAVISSSKNCPAVLEAAGIADLFDTRVDGVESERLGLKGKPNPTVFLEAARRLGVDPARAAVVEDAIAGVQAGRDGHFACVVGVNRNGGAKVLEENGANIVVHDLSELVISPTSAIAPLPSALEHFSDIVDSAQHKQLVIFLDFDGTLTPIVSRPEDAHLSDTMRTVLQELARTWTVAIVSGRDLEDVRQRVHLEQLYYAGSHGFEIAGPNGFQAIYGPAQAFLTDLDQAEGALRNRLDGIAGVQVERKHFAIAVHYRRASEADVDTIAAVVDGIQQTHPALRRTGGKKVFELRPDLDWHKGTALFWLLEAMDLDRNDVLAVYIGDDVTDEDAFLALRDAGIGIIVTDGSSRHTAARYALAHTEAVGAFLEALAGARKRSDTR